MPIRPCDLSPSRDWSCASSGSRRLGLALFALLLLISPAAFFAATASAAGGATHVATTKVAGPMNGGTSLTTGTISVNAGDDLIVGCIYVSQNATAVPPTITDSLSSSWTKDKGLVVGDVGASLSHLHNVSGSRTITCTADLGWNMTIFVSEFSGVDTSQADGTGAAQDARSTTTPFSGNFSTTNANDLLISLLNLDVANTSGLTVNAGANWTIPTNGNQTSSNLARAGGIEYQIVSAAGIYNGTWSTSLGTDNLVLAFAYKASAAATYSITGTITGGAGATVTLSGAASASTTANSSGGFTFSGLANGTYTVTPTLTGYTITPASQNVTVSGANPAALSFTATANTVTYSITGTVTGGAGATVTLSGAASASTTANSSGGFTFSGLANGTYTVTPTLTGYTITPASQNVTINGANAAALSFTATANTTSLKAISIDFVGLGTAMGTAEIAGVIAKSFWNNATGASNTTGLALVDETGTATPASVAWRADNGWSLPITDSPGNVRMMIGYLDTGNTNPTTVTVSGLAAGTYDIYVYADASNGSGTKTATYQIAGSGFTTQSTTWIDPPNTNFSGTFIQASNSAGNYVKFSAVTATGFTITATPVSASDGILRAAVNGIQMIPTGSAPTFIITGTITGGAGATVVLSGAASATVTANSSGSFTFTGLLNGNYVVTPSLAGFTITPSTQSVTINGANPPALSFTTTAIVTYSITGTITNGAGATVALSGTATATVIANSSGGFTFTTLANGTYTVTPTLTGYTISPISQNVTINGANPAALSFTATAISGTITLTQTSSGYTIQNAYYQAVIPAPGQAGAGLVRFLYIKKQNGQWSNNLVKQNTFNYALGYMEGGAPATQNSSYGLSSSGVVVTVLENTSTRIRIQATNNPFGTAFTETWTFWAGKRYFESDATAVVTQTGGILTNQLQYCWMINDSLPFSQYGTDANGNVISINSVIMQPINSPNLNTYPWNNWQFTGEPVSLGIIFTSVYDHAGTIAETGDRPFEYQLDFDLGSGVLGSPEYTNYTRSVSTIYYTDNVATNTDIAAFAQTTYQNAASNITTNPAQQAAEFINNPLNQNAGNGSAIVNAPYFLMRQNTQNPHYVIEYPQYATSIYGPLYKTWTTIHSSSYDFQDQLKFSLNYDSASSHFTYGTISVQNPLNGAITSLQHVATSSDGKLRYSSTLQTWNDSDKLEITGSASNASSSASVKDIYVLLTATQPGATFNNLGPGLYDLAWTDPMLGNIGIAVQVNSPASTNVVNGTSLYAYMYNQSTAQTLSTFNYSFDVVIWPHMGWLSGPSAFTALHSQAPVTYNNHTFTPP